jgi:hypothetical protein
VALSKATAPPIRHEICSHEPATQVSRVSDDVTIAVSPSVAEVQAGRVEELPDSSWTGYRLLSGRIAGAEDVATALGPPSSHPALPTSATPHNDVSPANAASFITPSSRKP